MLIRTVVPYCISLACVLEFSCKKTYGRQKEMSDVTRKQALTYVTAYVAEDGGIHSRTLRIYVENRISYPRFQDAVNLGMRVYLKAHPEEARADL